MIMTFSGVEKFPEGGEEYCQLSPKKYGFVESKPIEVRRVGSFRSGQRLRPFEWKFARNWSSYDKITVARLPAPEILFFGYIYV